MPVVACNHIPGAVHSDHVHKGAIFTLGLDKSGKDIPEFERLEKADQRTLALLKVARCVGDATDAEIVARVNAEVAEDNRRAENTKRIQAAGTPDANLIAHLPTNFKTGRA